ncbi:hypothetical protein ACTA71_009681 [Dictyostelium dimigraforme]
MASYQIAEKIKKNCDCNNGSKTTTTTTTTTTTSTTIPTSSIPISTILPKLIESNKELQNIKLKSIISNSSNLNLQNNLYKPILETNNNSIKTISFKMLDLNVCRLPSQKPNGIKL